jgi:hypothetical protein
MRPEPCRCSWQAKTRAWAGGATQVEKFCQGTLEPRSILKFRLLATVLVVALAVFTCMVAVCASDSFAKRVDIGGGRVMYIECHGSGSPTVLLLSGTDAAPDLWHAADQKGPTVYDDIQQTTRVCAYDRPGAPADQPSKRGRPQMTRKSTRVQ